MSRLEEMQAFVAIVESGSFVAAAAALGTSKSAVSRQLGNLERRLNVRLLQRTTRRLSLTEEGRVFHGRCKDLLEEIASAEAEVAARSEQAVGPVRINAPVTFGILHLAALWPAFCLRHPRVELNVTLMDRVVDLVEEGYDLAIRIAQLPSSTLVTRKLAATRLILCASPGYLERAGTPRHPAELAEHAVIAYSYFATGDEWPFAGPDGPARSRIRPFMRTNNGDTCRAAALAGQGIVLQPSFLVGPDLEAGRLVELLPDHRSLELGIYVVYPTRRHLPLKIRLLVEFLAEAFRQPGWTS